MLIIGLLLADAGVGPPTGPGNLAPMGVISPPGPTAPDCRGEAPGNRGILSAPLGVVGPLHILGVLGDGTGNLESIEGVLGPL